MLNKIDTYLFHLVEKVVLKWVKKKKYKQHKYDWLAMVQKYEVYYWVVAIAIIMVRFGARHLHEGIFTIGLVVNISCMAFLLFLYKQSEDSARRYDELFIMRRNPIAHIVVKKHLKQKWEDEQHHRYITLAVYLAGFLMYIFLPSPLVLIWPMAVAKMYVPYVFDFEEPDKKEKVKESVTEITLNAFRSLVRGLGFN